MMTTRSKLLVLIACCLTAAAEPIRIFVTDSESWQVSGGFSFKDGTGGGALSGGARPQTVEVMKNFFEKCKGSVVTMDRTRAEYVVIFNEGGKGAVRRDNKIAVFKINGDLLYTGSPRSLGNAAKDACSAITNPK